LKIVWIYKYLVYASLFCVPWGGTDLNLKQFFTLEIEFFYEDLYWTKHRKIHARVASHLGNVLLKSEKIG